MKLIKKEKRKHISCRLPERQISHLRAIAKHSGVTFTDLVQAALDLFLKSFSNKK